MNNLNVVFERDVPYCNSVFGIAVDNKKARPTMGYAADNPFIDYVPAINKGYFFSAKLRSNVLMWLNFPFDQSLWISGPTGCGKTSVVEQIAARLNWPVMKITASQDLDLSSVTGGLRLTCDPVTGDTKTVYMHGPLALAYKYGFIFMIDEYDQLEPAFANAFNGVLEGGNLIIPETNEVIHRNENFRFVATANSVGQGDMTGVYAGVKNMNVANMERFLFVNAAYMEVKEEEKLISEFVDEIIAMKFVEVANIIRKQFIGTDVNGNESMEFLRKKLSVTCSTRSLKAWVQRFVLFKKAKIPHALHESYLQCIGNRATADDRASLISIIDSVFGKNV